jgi:putative ABC transport system permease protein
LQSADDRDDAEAALAARMPAELFVQTPAAATEMIDTTFRSTQLALRLAGAFSVAMAAFIILNTLRLNFSERRRDFAVVRVVGATRGQLFSAHLVEGMLLGAFGAALGIPLGMLLGLGLEQVMAALLGVTPRMPEISASAVAGVLVLGPLMTGFSAIVPAIQARSMSAGEAMGDAEPRQAEKLPLWAVAAGIGCWIASVVLVWLVVVKRLPPAAAIPAGILMLVAFVAIIPAVVRPMLIVARRLTRSWGVEGQLGADQLLARSTRTGLTIGVLVVAISSGLGLGTAIINNVEDVRGWYRRSLAGDVFLTDPAALDETTVRAPGTEIEARVAQQPGVATVVQIRLLSAKVDGASALCVVRDFRPEIELPWELSQSAESELRARLVAGEVALGNVLANQLNLAPGNMVRLEIQGRVFERRIAILVNDYMQGGRCVYLNQQSAAQLTTLGPPYFMIVYAADGTPVAELTSRLRKFLSSEGIVVQSFVEMRSQLDGLINGVVFALWGLLGVGFIVGGVAVANTLTLNVLEQTRELGLLRIIGLTPAQTRWLVLNESLLLGAMGALLGTLGGVTTALVIHFCNGPVLGRPVPFELHPWLVIANAGGCLLIALLAAWRPGLSASRLNVLSAIAYE